MIERTCQLLAWLEELLWLLRDTLGTEEPGSVGTAQVTIRDLEAMEKSGVRAAARPGRKSELGLKTALSACGPWRLANSPALSIAFPIAYFDSLGLPRLFAG